MAYVSPIGVGKLSLIALYPSMKFVPEVKGSADELLASLVEGTITALGIPKNKDGVHQQIIPAQDWLQTGCYGGTLFKRTEDGSSIDMPWRDIFLESADIRKYWRSDNEIDGRSRYNWDAIKMIFDKVKEQNPEFSDNDLIIEAQGAYEERFNKEPPSRSSFQSHMKKWR